MNTYCVIAREELQAPLADAARAIAQATGRVPFDVARELREKVGILASGLTKDQADRAAGHLSQVHVSAFVLDERQLVEFPAPVLLETAKLEEDALGIPDLRGERNERLGAARVPYKDVVLIAAACVTTTTEKRVVEGGPTIQFVYIPRVPGVRPGITIPGRDDNGRTVRVERQSHLNNYLDIFADEPAHHLRLNAGTFNFALTGLKLRHSSFENLAEFIKHFAPLCERAELDPSIRRMLDGDPLTTLRMRGIDQYDAYLRWRIQLLYHPDE